MQLEARKHLFGKIIAFRNILIHAYAAVDDRIVWGVVEGDLPALRTSQAELLPGA
jgi:uncharacterized protein with HEPN domain